VAPAATVAQELATLFTRLGIEALVRDPDSVEVLAATPGAEAAVLASTPGTVRVVTARVAGAPVRVEVLPAQHGPESLTHRQLQIANGLKRGLQNQQMAEELGISLHTVRRHIEQVFRRLGVNNRKAAVDALKRAARQ
jgi:DNA-binding NarL/FixJ family response regulator